MIVGEEAAVTELWEALEPLLPPPADDRPGQPVLVLDRPQPAAGTGLRPAGLDDLDLLVEACAAAYREEVGIDAWARDPELFRWRTRSQIELGRSWLWLVDGRIRFKAEASAWTPSAVQLQQVWVDPALRGRGYARAGFADLCRLLLERTPRVCLFARPENAPALALYRGAGMRTVGTYRSLIFP
jgi:ribosomal protein S18 acetylase RimI-like enzyme